MARTRQTPRAVCARVNRQAPAFGWCRCTRVEASDLHTVRPLHKSGSVLVWWRRVQWEEQSPQVRPGLGFQSHLEVHLPAASGKAAPTGRLAPGGPWMTLVRFPFSSGEPCLGVASSFISTRPEFDLMLHLPPQRG